jgi:hypothetical protein
MRAVRAPSRFTTQPGSPRNRKGLSKIFKIFRRLQNERRFQQTLNEAEQDAMEELMHESYRTH